MWLSSRGAHKQRTDESADVTVTRGDVPYNFVERCIERGSVSWDVETSGLDWATDTLATCQLAAGDQVVVVQLDPSQHPISLATLLEDQRVRKVFHHAPFDLRFMAYQWKVRPTNVACTKALSKILDPQLSPASHSLRPVLQRRLGVEISKTEQASDWLAAVLTPSQLTYAVRDVLYLDDLLADELEEARHRGLLELVHASFAYAPARVALDLLGSGDVFSY